MRYQSLKSLRAYEISVIFELKFLVVILPMGKEGKQEVHVNSCHYISQVLNMSKTKNGENVPLGSLFRQY